MSKVFIDTTILIYCSDKDEKHKRDACRRVLLSLEPAQAVVSTQVLQEFYVVATKVLRMDPVVAKGLVHEYSRMETVVVSTELIGEAIDCANQHRLSFWDALIIAAAESAGCRELWTEDMNAGQKIRGVLIKNPM